MLCTWHVQVHYTTGRLAGVVSQCRYTHTNSIMHHNNDSEGLSVSLCRGQYSYITKQAVVLDHKVSKWKYGISEIMNLGLYFA